MTYFNDPLLELTEVDKLVQVDVNAFVENPSIIFENTIRVIGRTAPFAKPLIVPIMIKSTSSFVAKRNC
jgi:hypothetical protein